MKQTAVKRNTLTTSMMAKVALLAAAAGVLMLLEFPLWFAPPFYKLDLSELPVLIGALTLGPMAGVLIELVKILLNFAMNGTVTWGIGEIANFIIGCSFILPVALIHQKYQGNKGLFLGFALGIVSMCAVGAVANGLVLLPVYAMVFGLPIEGLIAMGTAINPYIVDMPTFVLWAVVPFNLLKGIILSVLAFLMYRRMGARLQGNRV